MAVGWIPLVGFLAVFYCFYLHTTGLRRVHGISTGRSLVAILILTALVLILVSLVALYDYSVVREAMQTPVSNYFPKPKDR